MRYIKKKCFTYSVVSHFKTRPLVIEANNTSVVNHSRFVNDTLPTLIFHIISLDGKSQITISPFRAENEYSKKY